MRSQETGQRVSGTYPQGGFSVVGADGGGVSIDRRKALANERKRGFEIGQHSLRLLRGRGQSPGPCHGLQIIRINNWYAWNPEIERRELRLSNGSIGVLCNNKEERRAYCF
jgi:hypothetical protein